MGHRGRIFISLLKLRMMEDCEEFMKLLYSSENVSNVKSEEVARVKTESLGSGSGSHLGSAPPESEAAEPGEPREYQARSEHFDE